ncbi:PaaI family thioesterase [Amycolatopsis sp. H20-H5]|uniref:PaaI family thioesterase n=1 Tax=Amycolatopsis sp. H20-H5 TaxID=3046309 RepID=UPI002DBA5A77|nr:PaaI family thioesterase [Amycolatopsis sp. H20-H5]MEC3982501.1 PaaI family thioesterase [Amycolatopsis sp. H20-H5]
MGEVPPGFEPFASSPFVAAIGPVWIRRGEGPPTLGAVVGEQHANTGGTAHGGFLATLVDLVLAQGVKAVARPGARLVTAGLTLDFAEPVPLGSWVEARADVQRQSRRTVFANCFLVADGHRAVRGSGIFTVVT